MNYTFDPKKAASNVAKHGVFFSRADEFEWESAVIDVVLTDGESRLVSIAPAGERIHVLVVTLRETHLRIISMRRASRKEVERYVASQK